MKLYANSHYKWLEKVCNNDEF